MSTPTPEEAAAARAVRETVDSLSARQPGVSDWPSQVRQRVARHRTQRTAAAAVAVVITAGGVAVGAAAAVSDRPDALVAGPGPAVTASAPQPSASPAAPSASSPPSTTSNPTPAPTAPTAPTAPSLAPVEPTPEAQPERTWPPYGTQQIRIDSRPSNPTPAVGEELVVEVTVTGNADREPFLQGPRIDNSGPGWIAGSCPAPAEGSPPPARPQTLRKTFRHTFDTPGRHELAFRADSSCSYYRGEAEHVLIVDVQPAS